MHSPKPRLLPGLWYLNPQFATNIFSISDTVSDMVIFIRLFLYNFSIVYMFLLPSNVPMVLTKDTDLISVSVKDKVFNKKSNHDACSLLLLTKQDV